MTKKTLNVALVEEARNSGIDVEAELMAILQEEIAKEIDAGHGEPTKRRTNLSGPKEFICRVKENGVEHFVVHMTDHPDYDRFFSWEHQNADVFADRHSDFPRHYFKLNEEHRQRFFDEFSGNVV